MHFLSTVGKSLNLPYFLDSPCLSFGSARATGTDHEFASLLRKR